MPTRYKISSAPNGEDTSLDGTEKFPVSGGYYALVSSVAAYIRTLTQTLTGKTINLTDNTLTGTTAQFNTALSDNDFATLAGAEALTNKTINLTSNTLTGTMAQFDTAVSDGNIAYNAFKTIAVSGQSDVVADSSTDTLTIAAGSNVTITTNATTDTITIASSASGTGDVVGPGSATDNAVTRFDSTTGKLVQNSVITIDDTGIIAFPDDITQVFNPGTNNAGINVGSIAGDPATPDNGDMWYDSTANELTARINGANVALGAGGGGSVATDAIFDAKGDLAVGTGADTAAKLSVGSATQILAADADATQGLAWINMPLAVVSYNPNTETTTATSSTTAADIDATNLTITFTAPKSGKVLVRLSGSCFVSNAGNYYMWVLRTTGGTNVAGTKRHANSNANVTRVNMDIYVTGLTGGASTTYRWGHLVSANTGSIRYGDDGSTVAQAGAATMEVWSVT